ncbi:MAG: restriction endonuclease subunit S [Pseudomonadota bacterium]
MRKKTTFQVPLGSAAHPQRCSIGSLGQFFRGKGIAKSDLTSSGVPCLRYADIYTMYGDVIHELRSFVAQAVAKKALCIQYGDIIFAASGETTAEIGKAVAYLGKGNAVVGGDTVILRGHGQDPSFLAHALNSKDAVRQKSRLGKGQSIAHIHEPELTRVEVWVPPVLEQRRVAAILSTWDEALDRLSRQIARKERLFASLRERLVHGAHRIRRRNALWPIVTLGEVTEHLMARNGERFGRDSVMGVSKAEGIVPMKEHVIADDIARYLIVPPNAFAYNPMRINIGSIAMSEHEGDVIVSPDYVVFACKQDRLHPRFLNHLRRTKAWSDFMTIAGNGSVRVRIYYASLAEFEFHLPPLDEQLVIIEVLDDAEREITALEAERAALTKQRDALATKLLTGRIRVKHAETVP